MAGGLSQVEAGVCREIVARAPRLLDDLRRYVETPTGPGASASVDELRDVMRRRLEGLGAKSSLIPGEGSPAWLGRGEPGAVPPVLLCRRSRPGAGKARILLSGHLDTVHDPAGAFRLLSISPDGKTATGPGCVDMKGGLVIALHALEALESTGCEASWSFILNSDEETGSYHSDAALRAAAGEHDVGLALEPAGPGGALIVERAGSGQFVIECRGKAAHVGRDFASGVSAVNALASCISRVAAMPRPDQGIIANVGSLEGGIAPNVVPDRARAWGNIRYPDEAAGLALEHQLKGLETPPGALPAVGVRTSLNRPAKPLNPPVQRLADLARAAAEDLGQKLPLGKTGGVCDGNNLQAAGLATIDTLGVRGGGLHTPEEWIELPSLVERCQLLAVLVSRLTQGAWKG